MDDAQQIVLVALQQAGIQVPEAARAPGNELNSASLVAICAQAVNALGGRLPSALPPGTAERFRACTDLAGAVKLLGYRGDLSFHQFLYPSHKDTHKLLRFLLEKLSKSKSRGGRKARGASSRVRGFVLEALTSAHGDAHTGEVATGEVVRFQTSALRTSVVKAGQVKATLVTLKAKPRHTVLPSLLELNARSVVRADDAEVGILRSHGEFLPVGEGGGEVVAGESGGEALLQQQLDALVEQADRMEAEARAAEDRLAALRERREAKAEEIRSAEVLREGLSLGADEEAIRELQEEVLQGERHMASLEAEWEAVRRPLEERKAEMERDAVAGGGELASKTRKLREIRLQLQECAEKLRVREEQQRTLEMDLQEISSRPKRSSYVHRITELVKNSLKQETDIAKIIADTRALQRDSNATNDRLRRTYALVDELVFRDAKKDSVCRQSYRQLTTIHETFADIVDKVLEMDKTGRDIADLQAQLEELQKSSLDVESVQADLDAVGVETRALERRHTSLNIPISAS